jgi:hypothetical protein
MKEAASLANPHFAEPLEKMRQLLTRVHADYFADRISEVLDLVRSDTPSAIDILLSNEFWGGAGSFSDLYLCKENGHTSSDFERDNRELRRLLLGVLTNLRAEGYVRRDFDFHEAFLRENL